MALNEYKRATDEKNLVQDRNLEATELLYIPVVDSFGELSVGNSDPDKPAAISAYKDGGKAKMALYDGKWRGIGFASRIERSNTFTLNWKTDTATDSGGTATTITYFDAFGNTPIIQTRVEIAANTFMVQAVPTIITLDGNGDIDTIELQTGTNNSITIIK